MSGVVIVGASIAGLTTAEALRAEGFSGRIALIGDERHLPYSRPPLSKQVLLGLQASTDLVTREQLASLNVDLHLGVAATGLDLRRKAVLTDGGEFSFDVLIIATGVSARHLPGTKDLAGVHTLRTRDDAHAIMTSLEESSAAVIVGAGILGSEIAAATTKLGLKTSLVGHSPLMRFGQVGTLLSDLIVGLHKAHGVDLYAGTAVRSLEGEHRVCGVTLSDRRVIRADAVIVAVGSTPNLEWCRSSGLPLGDGLLCDANGEAAPSVFGVGDAANWASPAGRRRGRTEHQQSAIEQAHAVARRIADRAPAPSIVPFFWSELYGHRIQAWGPFGTATKLEIVAGARADLRFVAAATNGEAQTSGLIGWGMPREFREFRAVYESEVAAETAGPHLEGALSA